MALKLIDHGSPDYRQMIRLRTDMLRKPLGLHFEPEELEKEKGGSGLRYSFDIEKGRVIHEVGIDAKTGRVLENSVEGVHAD